MLHENEFVMTDFFARDCPHCQTFEPIWFSSARDAGNIGWEQKECFSSGWAQGADHDFCKQMAVSRFPTVKLLHYAENGSIDNSWDFGGERTADALHKFAEDKMREISKTALQRGIVDWRFLCAICHRQPIAGFL